MMAHFDSPTSNVKTGGCYSAKTVDIFVQDVLAVHQALFCRRFSPENIHQRSTHETLEAHGKISRSMVRKTTLLLNQLGSAKNEERTFKLGDGGGAGDERRGSWQRTRNDVPDSELQCLLDHLAMFQKGTARHRVIHEKATQNKDENPREFQRTAVQLHRRLAKELLAEYISFTCDQPNLRTHLRMEAESKIVSSHVVPYVVCESVVANATKCCTRSCATMGEKEWRRKRALIMPPC